MHRAIEQILKRAQDSRSESDFSYFFSLLLAGEALVKTVVLGMVAAIGDDKDRNRYRLEHKLTRASGLGDWSGVFEDALTGPASQYLLAESREEQTELTKAYQEGAWQYTSVLKLKSALDSLGIEAEGVPVKTDMKRWLRLFTTLRNKTRGHGAPPPAKANKSIQDLERSISLFAENSLLLKRPWAYLYRNISGKYRVSPITDIIGPFDYLKKESQHAFKNGVYIHFGSLRNVPLLQSDPELRDFFFCNGGLNEKRYELLSYSTDDKIEGDATEYSVPPGILPASETEGRGELLPRGSCLSNAPDLIQDYVSRTNLERDLLQLLLDDHHPIATLAGRGGIGKTSLSIKVIEKLYNKPRFEAIIWLSARDIDLKTGGPKPVRPLVTSAEEMAKLYAKLVLPESRATAKEFNSRQYFEQQLSKNESGACLFVFDNFETTQNPLETYDWIDCFIRSPNKALITTRMRDFKGAYPLEVGGMSESESRILINQTSDSLRIRDLLTDEYTDKLIQRSEGHPYIIKILLGEVARARRLSDIERIVAGSDEVLTAMFERTYASLSPCAQRAFMTMSAWNSPVPRLALEAVLMRAVSERQEVERGVESLVQFSMAETYSSSADDQISIKLPMVARAFGRKKLNVSPIQAAITIDVELLKLLGPSRSDEITQGIAWRLSNFIENICRRIDDGEAYESFAPILEMICRSYNPGWLLLAKWHMEREFYSKAKVEISRYLEDNPSGDKAATAWRMLANVCYKTSDFLGEVHAFIERAQLEAVPFNDISSTANRLNTLLREQELILEKDQKRHLAQRLLSVLEKRKTEASATDFSRMAWLALHLNQETQATAYVKEGLKKDPENYYCRRIAEKFSLH